MKTYLVFTVQGYEVKTETGTLIDNAEINIIANTADEALTRAKGIIKKTNYRIAKVVEFYDK